MKTFYKNRLPHIAPIGATFFVTFRLADSLPIAVIQSLKEAFDKKCQQLKAEKPLDWQTKVLEERKRYFGKFDYQLDHLRYGYCYLKQSEIAAIVANRIHQYDGRYYDLHAYCIMPNHVHLLIDTMEQLKIEEAIYMETVPINYSQLHRIMRLIKGGSAKRANDILQRTGTFWMKDSYDHYVRNEREWSNIIAYILNNPVKSKLVNHWQEWPFSYCKKFSSGD